MYDKIHYNKKKSNSDIKKNYAHKCKNLNKILANWIQFSSVAQLCPTLLPHGLQCSSIPCPSPTPGVMDIQPSYPLLSPSPPAFSLSPNQGLLQWVGSSHLVSKVLEFSFSISPSNEYSGLISFRMDWLDLLAVQGTVKESSPTPQFKSINSSALSFLCGPILTSILNKWKKHSFDYMELVGKSL